MIKPPFLASILMFVALASANAAPITMVQSNNTSGQSWLTTGSWSNNAAPSPLNDYFVTGSAFTVRTPQTAAASYTFEGNSLTIDNARLLFATLGGSNISISNLTLTNGGMFANGTADTQTLSGGLNISGSAFVRLATTATARNITIASQITGSGDVGFVQNGTLTLNGTGNTFSGTWTVGGTGVTTPDGTYSNTSTLVSTLMVSSEGSLGINSDVVLNLWSRFDLNYDWTTSGSLTLADNGVAPTAVIMTLDTNVTVGALTVADFSFAAGTYDYDDFLNAGFGDYFTNSGGMITVIPEPHTLSLLLPLGLGVMLWLRRRRRAVSSAVG